MRRTVPLLITAVVGLTFVARYFVPALEKLADQAAVWFDIIAGFALVLGGGNLVRNHGEKIYNKQAGWGYSAITLTAFFATLGVGLFKIGVQPLPGYWTQLGGTTEAVGLASLDVADAGRTLKLVVRRAPPHTSLPIRLGNYQIGEIAIDGEGKGSFPPGSGRVGKDPPTLAGPADSRADSAQRLIAGATGLEARLADIKGGETITVGSVLQGQFRPYAAVTGDQLQNGSALWFIYSYGFQPLQQTTFALVAFYMASAAFRAFRARNVESVLLLGTAALILLGRTYLGTWLTSGLPAEGFWSFFHIPNLAAWIMAVPNTAGGRAIMIGIALGIASTSLKVLVGIDRSHLGSGKR